MIDFPTVGRALRTDKHCPVHGLHHVRLVRKGSRPWEIGCPLCHHIESNTEAFALMPSLTPALHETLLSRHIYTVSEVAGIAPAGSQDPADMVDNFIVNSMFAENLTNRRILPLGFTLSACL